MLAVIDWGVGFCASRRLRSRRPSPACGGRWRRLGGPRARPEERGEPLERGVEQFLSSAQAAPLFYRSRGPPSPAGGRRTLTAPPLEVASPQAENLLTAKLLNPHATSGRTENC